MNKNFYYLVKRLANHSGHCYYAGQDGSDYECTGSRCVCGLDELRTKVIKILDDLENNRVHLQELEDNIMSLAQTFADHSHSTEWASSTRQDLRNAVHDALERASQ